MTGPSDLQPVLDALTSRFGWLTALITWIGLFRIFFKWFSARLQTYLQAAVDRVRMTADLDDDLVVDRVLRSRAYRLLAFLVDLVFSIKLPLDAQLPPERPRLGITPVWVAGLLILGLSTGCVARFKTKQTDFSFDGEGRPTRQITTLTTVATFNDSKSELSKFKVNQTDKSQSAAIGTLSQDSGGTNFAVNAAALADLLKILRGY